MNMQADDKFADNNFTPLRLGLALLVVLGHYKLFIGINSPAWPFNYAALAVECFFVVSGYLVANSFDRDPDLKRFFIKRFFRIYPLYITVVIAQTLILGSLAPGGIMGNLGSMGTYLLANAAFANFLQYDVGAGALTGLYEQSINASLWTLKIEFAFYLMLPFLWRLFERRGVGVLVAIFLTSALYNWGFEQAGHHTLAKQLPGQLQFFVLGVAAYRYRHMLRLENKWVGLGIAIVLGAVVTALLTSRPPLIYPLLVAALVVFLALLTPRLRMEADVSYGVYLLHAPMIQLFLLFGIYEPGLEGVAITVVLVLALAFLAERFVEAPGIAMGRKLIKRLGRRPTTPPPGGPGELTVVMLNDYCHVQGGASKVAIDEAVRLSQSGVKVIFVGAVGPVCDALRDAPVEVHCLGQHELLEAGKHPSAVPQGLWNGKAAKRVADILRALPADRTIVHLHGYTKALTTAPVRMAERMGVPVICTLHDFFPACPNGAFFNYQTALPCTQQALSGGCIATRCDKRRHVHKLFRVARGLIQRLAGRFPASVGHYIALSERSAAILSPYLPPHSRIHRLPNPVEAPRAVPAPVALNDMILYLGRLDEEKGVRLLARTAATLGLSVTFVGEGPLRAEIEAIPGMKVTGWLGSAEIQTYLSRARCLVFPSLWYETFGLTVSEAAARGVPAIVSDITAAAERVEDGVTGWRFRSGDADDLARCLLLVKDDTRMQAAGTAAYNAFWSDTRSGDRHVADLLEIYRKAVGMSGPVMAAEAAE
ncbi:acyltransferase family protein [Niveispirillum sp. KHB5.9]|uniref:acyltransferase family protein n=1 Tax=Niveispirillum sp. KHB5.9 TaxID=3400269 RepID=UPI003A888E79